MRNSSSVSDKRPSAVTIPSARTFSKGMNAMTANGMTSHKQRYQHRTKPRHEGADDGILGILQARIFLEEKPAKELHRMTRARRHYDEWRQQRRSGEQRRAEQQPVQAESHQRAQHRDPQWQQHTAKGSEAVPEDRGDGEDERREREGHVAKTNAVHPSNQDRRARRTDGYPGALVLLNDLRNRMINCDRFGDVHLRRERPWVVPNGNSP